MFRKPHALFPFQPTVLMDAWKTLMLRVNFDSDKRTIPATKRSKGSVSTAWSAQIFHQKSSINNPITPITFSIISPALWNVESRTKYSSHFVIMANASSKCRCAIMANISSGAIDNQSGPQLIFIDCESGLIVKSLAMDLVSTKDFCCCSCVGGFGAGPFFGFDWLNLTQTSNFSIHSVCVRRGKSGSW